jgi:hypothetical protein
MDADTKLVPCVMIGDRNGATAHDFISDLASRLRYRVRRTVTGHIWKPLNRRSVPGRLRNAG